MPQKPRAKDTSTPKVTSPKATTKKATSKKATSKKAAPREPKAILPLRPPSAGPAADAFWAMIARVEAASSGKREDACEAFRAELEALDDTGLVEMASQFRDAMVRALDNELWSGAFVLHGGCGDDTFWDFRAGLVALGRDHYEAALRDPDTLADIPDVKNRTLYEGFQYVPDAVLEARGSSCEPPAHGPGGAQPTRVWIEDGEQERRFPKLTALSA